MHAHDDFAFEPSPGLPAPLPPGERVLWQGSPDWRALARTAFHVRGVALWFVAIAALELLWTLGSGAALSPAAILPDLVRTALLGALAVAILATLAWLNARVTIYTVTDRRVLIRFGIALEITMNLPFAEIDGASLRVGPRGTGDIPLAVADTRGVGYAVLWPHVRPWRLARPEPMLRAVPRAERVARLLAAAMHEAAATGEPARGAAPSPILAARPTPAASPADPRPAANGPVRVAVPPAARTAGGRRRPSGAASGVSA